jgi:hypothetical protein
MCQEQNIIDTFFNLKVLEEVNPMSKFLKARKFQVHKIKPFCIKNIVPKKKKKQRETSIIGITFS